MSTAPSWGSDGLVRALRALAVLALLAILAIVALDPDRPNALELCLVLVGAVLAALGYPVILNIPWLASRKNGKDGAG